MEGMEDTTVICICDIANEVTSYARNVCVQSGCGNSDTTLRIFNSSQWN